jgi:hypothetical protein
LADHGELTFNLGEGHSGATSYLYPLAVALIRVVSGERAISVILILNSIALLLTTYLLAGILGRAFDLSEGMRLLVWAALSITPVPLLMAVRGMEAPYVALIFVLGLRGIQKAPGRLLSLLPLLALPFIRPDALAFSLILAGLSFAIAPRLGKRYLAAAISGAALLAVANYFTFGSFLSATIKAKGFGLRGTRPLLDIARSTFGLYFASPLFSPLTTKYLNAVHPAFAVLALAVSVALLWKLHRVRSPHFASVTALLAAVWLVPGAYGMTGIVFPWYLWPSQLLYQGVLVAGVFYLTAGALRPLPLRLMVGGILMGLLCATGLQLMQSYSTGVQESGYRASVGKYIAPLAQDGDTLYLEPAGYIPFYANLRTIDEVGLASSTILKYKRDYRNRWWIEAVQQEKPTFLVQRHHIVKHKTFQGYQMTPAEAAWFDSRYELIRLFKYQPEEFTAQPYLRWILRLGAHDDYYVFKFRDSR